MGMAASQARYLSLSARKTNVEYEGQQINQQRLVLSNQSADLFNQMLTMSVPTPPNSSDFTKLQYSWVDGDISSVIDEYYQIGTIDDEFNYVVSSYHYENQYVGQRKFLVDPQILATKENHFSDNKNISYTIQTMAYNKDNDTYTFKLKNGFDQELDMVFKPADYMTKTDAVEEIDFLYGRTTEVGADQADSFVVSEDGSKITYNSKIYTKVSITDDAAGKTALEKLQQTYGAFFDQAKTYYKSDDGKYICKENIDEAKADQTTKIIIRSEDTDKYYTDGKRYFSSTTLKDKKVGDTIVAKQCENNPTWHDYKSIGNQNLTLIDEDMYKNNIEIRLAIEQILTDMKSSEDTKTAYDNIMACFDENGNYTGGLYTFKMSGNTYFTTVTDMDKSLLSAYTDKSVADNGIDSQQAKLSYYNAIYIKTKIDEVKKALLETDGQGRFKTAKFEDDSVIYDLKVETVKDEDAYNDAMNQYYYKQELYDKELARINAKTEIIQVQDRQLQLKLEQLNTEQSALQTEMEACQKIVSKCIEGSFKTFGG